jgi:hypothetical protein
MTFLNLTEFYQLQPVSMHWTDLRKIRQPNMGATEHGVGLATFHSDGGSICEQRRKLIHGGAREPSLYRLTRDCRDVTKGSVRYNWVWFFCGFYYASSLSRVASKNGRCSRKGYLVLGLVITTRIPALLQKMLNLQSSIRNYQLFFFTILSLIQ